MMSCESCNSKPKNVSPVTDYTAHLLRNVHEGLAEPEPGVTTLVNGDYQYWHYVCDGYDDRGWGCGYRTLQTIASWITFNRFGQLPVPSVLDVQKILVSLKDKDPRFILSDSWIGSFEICLTLEQRYNVRSKIRHVNSGRNLYKEKDIILHHFLNSRCPIMMGGDKDCSSKGIVGIHTGKENTYLLVVDPHFTGQAKSIEELQNSGWVKWHNINEFIESSFYNLCLPQIAEFQETS